MKLLNESNVDIKLEDTYENYVNIRQSNQFLSRQVLINEINSKELKGKLKSEKLKIDYKFDVSLSVDNKNSVQSEKYKSHGGYGRPRLRKKI